MRRMVKEERQDVRLEERRLRILEFLTAVGAVVVAFVIWFGIIALFQ